MTLDGKMRILLCEDDENLGMLLREYLQAKGYDTVLCSDGEEGYREFLRSKYNLCVFDVIKIIFFLPQIPQIFTERMI